MEESPSSCLNKWWFIVNYKAPDEIQIIFKQNANIFFKWYSFENGICHWWPSTWRPHWEYLWLNIFTPSFFSKILLPKDTPSQWGQCLEWPLWVHCLIYMVLLSLWCYMWCHVIIDLNIKNCHCIVIQLRPLLQFSFSKILVLIQSLFQKETLSFRLILLPLWYASRTKR